MSMGMGMGAGMGMVWAWAWAWFFSLGTTLHLPHSTYLHSYSVAEAQHTLFSLVYTSHTRTHINAHTLSHFVGYRVDGWRIGVADVDAFAHGRAASSTSTILSTIVNWIAWDTRRAARSAPAGPRQTI